MKDILCITGTRADFGRQIYLFRKIKEHPKLNLKLIVTGTHLEPEFGLTVTEVEKEFNADYKIKLPLKKDTKANMVRILGILIKKFSEIIPKINPDLILILGDRLEMLAAAIVGSFMNIPVAHIAGGQKSGSIDDLIRDSNTIFSDLHFVATKKNALKVRKLGANPDKIFIVGSIDIDAIAKKDYDPPKKVASKLNLDLSKPIMIVVQHPVIKKGLDNSKEIKEVLEAIHDFDMQKVIVYPNADAGGQKIILELLKYKKKMKFNLYKNIPYKTFLGLMNVATLIIGNSSCGIIEAPSFKLPAVNIGERQEGREKAKNVINVACKKDAIKKGIKKALSIKFKLQLQNIKNPYGVGNTSKQIIEQIIK